jgi:hypothetical protein
MALLVVSNLREITRSYILEKRNIDPRLTAESLIFTNNTSLEGFILKKEIDKFDIFLSHAFKDAEIVAGIMIELIRMGYTVYVDWLFDAHLSRESVTKSTANSLVTRMKQSASLFYATTPNAQYSKWMPWELGFKHGDNGKCAILPVKEYVHSPESFIGQEYLGVYEKVVKTTSLWICPEINSNLSVCDLFNHWAGVVPKKTQTLSSLRIIL